MPLFNNQSGPRGFLQNDDSQFIEVVPEKFNGGGANTSSVILAPHQSYLYTGNQTIAAQTRCLGAGEGATGNYIWSAMDGSNLWGPAFRIRTDQMGFGYLAYSTTGSINTPIRSSDTSIVNFGNIQNMFATYNGGLLGTDIRLFFSENFNTLVEYTAGSNSNGAGVISFTWSTSCSIGNNSANNRTFNGDIFWVARWNRILDITEMNLVRRFGPQVCPMGLFMHYVNGIDISYNHIPVLSRLDVLHGPPSLYVPHTNIPGHLMI